MIAASLIGLFSAITMDTPSKYEQALNYFLEIENNSNADPICLENALKTLETEELYTFGFSRT